MERKNIPSYVLAKGISKEGFDVLLDNIKVAVLEDGINKFNNYEEMVDEVKQKENGVISQEEIDQWVLDFEAQLKESSDVINENINQIEALFNRIFVDWDKYKTEHGIVEKKDDIIEEEKKEDVVSEEQFQPEVNVEETEASEVSSNEEKVEEKEQKKEKKSKKKKEVVTEGDNNE